MKITDVIIRQINIPLEKPAHFAWIPGKEVKEYGFTLVEIQTDEGITGYGTSNLTNDIQVATSIRNLYKPHLIGKDPFFVQNIMNSYLYMKPFGAPPWSVSQALWDIIGKAANQPLYHLWGAARERILAYAAPAEKRESDSYKEILDYYTSQEFKAIKLRIHELKMSDDIAIVETVRKHVGNKMDILVDANQALKFATTEPHAYWDYRRALKTSKELEKLDVFYLEEPLPMYELDSLSRLCSETEIYIAGAEANMGFHEFKMLLDKNCYDVFQPDASLSEDMFQIRNIGNMVVNSGKIFMPHTWGTGINLFVNLQIALTVPDSYSPYFEFPFDPETWPVELNQCMVKNPLYVDKDGYVNAPQNPGLGFILNTEIIEKYTQFIA
jgi:D-galactarolactone cycloisomerase